MKALIVGLGQIGVGYDLGNREMNIVATHARALTKHSSLELIGGVDQNAESRTRFTGNYSLPAFKDIREASMSLDADLVVIATPTSQHYSSIKELVSCMKPVVIVCEKPLAYSTEEARKIVDTCKESGAMLFVNYMRVCLPCVAEIKSIFVEPSITRGRELRGVAWYSGGIYNNGSHLVNLLEHWFGGVKSGSRRLGETKKLGEDITVDLKLVFDNLSLYLLKDNGGYSTNSIELLSDLGEMRYMDGGRIITVSGCELSEEFKGYKYLSRDKREIKSCFMQYQAWFYDALVKRVKGKGVDICSGMQALRTLSTIEELTK